MSVTPVRLVISAVLLLMPVFLAGGCPMGAADVAGLTSEPDVTAGVYWVDLGDGGLRYFDPGLTRGDEGRWRAINDADTIWFSAAGPHEFDPETGWQRIEGAETITLDDMIQLHDAAPKVPSRRP